MTPSFSIKRGRNARSGWSRGAWGAYGSPGMGAPSLDTEPYEVLLLKDDGGTKANASYLGTVTAGPLRSRRMATVIQVLLLSLLPKEIAN